MEQYNYLNKTNKIRDIEKGQKIAGALYLVTNHLSDTDPLKAALRTHAVTLGTSHHENSVSEIAVAITALLDTAVIARLISEKNASIISLELRHYVANMTSESDTVSALFSPVFQNEKLSYTAPKMSYNAPSLKISNPAKIPVFNESKSKRQDAILSFINERKSAGIKDIAALFSDTSEKTIQRELGALVSAGKITKRGEKRWSVYMAVA